ncbi:MAG TPA: alpha/beta fold hydrolase [Candidatus Paceibacterota bacterium]|jgi:pimeloyl-ACP methyl ester carboxylesterase|nr:alpha/beta fold hydrolase [Candidatus Paceibacterota bacterium]
MKFSIKNRKGLEIVGEILIPEKSIGLSFVLHGLGGFRTQNHIQIMAKTLFENNYTVVNFDATNSIGESGGKYEDATMQNHYEDLVDVITWSETQSWYKEPFVLAGHSMGGFAVAKYAEEFPRKVKGVFPYAAVFSGQDAFDAHNKFFPEEIKEWKETGWKTRIINSKPGTEMKLPWSHMEERLKHDLIPKAKNIIMPILFVVGENDTSCPPDQQKKFYDLLSKNTKKEFHIVKGAPHTFKEEGHLRELKEIFNNWLKKI